MAQKANSYIGDELSANKKVWFKLKSSHTGRCLAIVEKLSSVPKITTKECKTEATRFKFINVGGKFLLKNRKTNKCLYMFSNGTFSAHTCQTNSIAFFWKFPKVGQRSFQMSPESNNLCLFNINGAGFGFGTYHCSSQNKDQHWQALAAR